MTRDVDDRGFTLVELVVSLTVIATAVAGIIGVTSSSLGVATKTNHRARAVALATEELESLRAMPYERLEVTSVPVLRRVTSTGQPFDVERAVTWVPTPSVRNYKRGTVAVTWTDGAGTHSVSQSTFYYPGGLGAPAPAPGSCGGAPPAASALSARATGTADDPAVDLMWQTPAVPTGAWIVERSTDAFTTVQLVSDSIPPVATSQRVAGLASATTYYFRVVAVDACGQRSSASPVATATTTPAISTSCELGVPNVTPAEVRTTSASPNAGLSATPRVSISATSSCTGYSLQYRPTASTVRTAAFSASVGAITATIDPRGPWDIGPRPIDVVASGSGTTVARLFLTVCSHNASTCR